MPENGHIAVRSLRIALSSRRPYIDDITLCIDPLTAGSPPRGTGRPRPVTQQGRNLQWNTSFRPEHSSAYAAGPRTLLPRMPHSSPDVTDPVYGQRQPADFDRPSNQAYRMYISS